MSANRPRLFLSATRKSSGKTVVTIGLAAALARRGLKVQTFKKGLDFIDPMWHGRASGVACRNLDPYIMGMEGTQSAFLRYSAEADISLIEGNMGYFDGQDLEGADSSAALAEALQAPALLIVDCKGMARGVAPLVRGHLDFPGGGAAIGGVILNHVASLRHEKRLRAALARFTAVPVLGAIPRSAAVAIDERHLGLVPVGERDELREVIGAAADRAEEYLDLEAILVLARGVKAPGYAQQAAPVLASSGEKIRVAYAADRAFNFYYPDNLEALASVGVEMVPVDFLNDRRLPDVAGLFIGGGFPEMFMERLTGNSELMGTIRRQAEDGLPIYAECGGLMALSERLRWDGKEAKMIGALPIDVSMFRKPQGYGYMALEGSGQGPWLAKGEVARCHEFHYSRVTRLGEGTRFAYKVQRGFGVDGSHDGLLYRNIWASYAHIHVAGSPGWAEALRRFWRGGVHVC
ncbi:MAG: cobyrinate a,c-diamide synthase [Magnetococcales bacterium]|nr:cobyrinate a,c-diamide synthase [Magnetococcales bacterium]